MGKKFYDFWNAVGRFALPAIGTLYFTLSKLWCLPYADAIVGSVAAVTLCINTILRIDTKTNYIGDGVIDISKDSEDGTYPIYIDADAVMGKTITLYVDRTGHVYKDSEEEGQG